MVSTEFPANLHGELIREIFVGPAYKLDNGSATIWVQNQFAGVRRFRSPIAMGFGLLPRPCPQESQVFPRLASVAIPGGIVSQTSGDGVTVGAFQQKLDLHFVLQVLLTVQGQLQPGTTDITISTGHKINPPNENTQVQGNGPANDGSVTLVGDADVVGPTGTAHCWVEISGTLTKVV